MIALLTINDHPTFDLLRGIAAGIGVMLVASTLLALVALWARRHSSAVPRYVWKALAAWLTGDVYVASREGQQIGHALFLLGLPLALAWELCAIWYLRDLWTSTAGFRRRPEW